MSDLRKAIEQALKAWEQGLGHLARDTLKTALSETEQPPRLTDDTITIAYQMGSNHSDGLRNIETAVRKQFGYE